MWGILGNATIARKCVIPAIQKSKNGQIRMLGTRHPERAAEMATRHQIPVVQDTYEAVLADPQIDAIYIPLPNHLHLPWTIKAFEAGKHVLCEKPLACNAAEAQAMAAAASKHNRVLMEAMMYRFHPRSRQIKSTIANGTIGAPRLVRAAFCYHMDPEVLAAKGNARLYPEMGGGALLDVGCYCVSTARWMFEQEVHQVQAQASFKHDVDIHVVGTLTFSHDKLATIEASFISALQQTYTVIGSRGAIELPHDAFIPWEKDAQYLTRGVDEEEGQRRVVAGADEYQLMVEHFAAVVLEASPPDFSIQDSIRNMQVLDALKKAAHTGNTIKLDNGNNSFLPKH
jgi:predicted dehydrogenase